MKDQEILIFRTTITTREDIGRIEDVCSPYYNINTGQKEIAPDKKIVQFIPHKGFRFDDTPSTPDNDDENKKE